MRPLARRPRRRSVSPPRPAWPARPLLRPRPRPMVGRRLRAQRPRQAREAGPQKPARRPGLGRSGPREGKTLGHAGSRNNQDPGRTGTWTKENPGKTRACTRLDPGPGWTRGGQNPRPGRTSSQAGFRAVWTLRGQDLGKTRSPERLDLAPGRIPENRTPEEQESGPGWIQGDQERRPGRTHLTVPRTGQIPHSAGIPGQVETRSLEWTGRGGGGAR